MPSACALVAHDDGSSSLARLGRKEQAHVAARAAERGLLRDSPWVVSGIRDKDRRRGRLVRYLGGGLEREQRRDTGVDQRTAAPSRQAGGHWFEPSSAHHRKAPLRRGFLFSRWQRFLARGHRMVTDGRARA